jgi:hypothetical protein
MLQRWTNLVLERLAIEDRRRGLVFGVRGWSASLTYKGLENAVERTTVVGGGGAQGQEVLCRLWGGFAEDLEFEVTESGVKLRSNTLVHEFVSASIDLL